MRSDACPIKSGYSCQPVVLLSVLFKQAYKSLYALTIDSIVSHES